MDGLTITQSAIQSVVHRLYRPTASQQVLHLGRAGRLLSDEWKSIELHDGACFVKLHSHFFVEGAYDDESGNSAPAK